MKIFLFIFFVAIFCSCGGNTANYNVTDSANAIENHAYIEDTTVDTIPNGYAPPNDSVNAGNHHPDSSGH